MKGSLAQEKFNHLPAFLQSRNLALSAIPAARLASALARTWRAGSSTSHLECLLKDLDAAGHLDLGEVGVLVSSVIQPAI